MPRLPLFLIAGLALFGLAVSGSGNSQAAPAVWGGSAVLLAWWAALWMRGALQNRTLHVQLRAQHYVQACAQAAVFVYWGWYWPEVYRFAPLILAQIVFAYAFDTLLSWSRRETYALGFGPVPVVFSTNLFLWFRPQWFYWQLGLIALGLLAKEFLRWQRDGRRVHIFNPSSFPLAVFSVVLLTTHATGMTWGPEIASTQFYPPQMYLLLFLVGLPGQFLFGVTSMTMPAVLAAYLFGRIYFGYTGIYFFYDSYIPIAVFLGMHLLFTDPSTSPKSGLGRVMFGTLYGLSTVLFYQLLGSAGMPTFYDKLLPVPLLNLSVKGLDGIAFWITARVPLIRITIPKPAMIAAWVLAFAALSWTQGVGDRHPGQYIPFWQQACDDGRAYACPYLADLDQLSCDRGSSWACNEAGLMHVALARSGEDLRRLNPAGAAVPFERGCQLGLAAACNNLEVLTSGVGRFATPAPTVADFPVILRGSKGEISERNSRVLYAMACEQGWPGTCAEDHSKDHAEWRLYLGPSGQ